MTTKEEIARDFAINVHGNQMYGQYPYIKHLDDVYNIAIEFELSENIILRRLFLDLPWLFIMLWNQLEVMV